MKQKRVTKQRWWYLRDTQTERMWYVYGVLGKYTRYYSFMTGTWGRSFDHPEANTLDPHLIQTKLTKHQEAEKAILLLEKIGEQT